jgi:shikimate dehydrogenase
MKGNFPMQYFSVIGDPVSHSQSPFIHRSFAKRLMIDIDYQKMPSSQDLLEKHIKNFFNSGGHGLNITLPFKSQAYALCDQCSERAEKAGAVNTLYQLNNGLIIGDTTDGIGLIRDIRDNLDFSLHGKRILVLGAGGAARGILHNLLEEQPNQLVIANRSIDKANLLIKNLPIKAYEYSQLKGLSFDVIINATSSSLQGLQLPLPNGLFAAGSLAYDMAYGKGLTPFLHQAQQEKAALLADGVGMLVEQAAESFYIWHGVWPSTRSVLNELRDLLS